MIAEREVLPRLLVRQVGDVRLADEVHEEVRHADLGDQVDEARRNAEHEVAVIPQREVLALFLGEA